MCDKCNLWWSHNRLIVHVDSALLSSDVDFVLVLSSSATCEMCGMVGVRDAFYSKTKRFCSVSCSRSYSSNSKKASILARLQVIFLFPRCCIVLIYLYAWLSSLQIYHLNGSQSSTNAAVLSQWSSVSEIVLVPKQVQTSPTISFSLSSRIIIKLAMDFIMRIIVFFVITSLFFLEIVIIHL